MTPRLRLYLIQAGLFLITILTTTIAGTEWLNGESLFAGEYWPSLRDLGKGLAFSLPFLAVLTVHEFGHYFTARKNRVSVTLPYFLPLWLGPYTTIGTMGAFIRLKSRVRSNIQYFDIGIAGPLAGFAAALVLLWYGFTHLPPAGYVFALHPEWKALGEQYASYVYTPEALSERGAVGLGDNLLLLFFKKYVATGAVPSSFDMAHYPFLFAGYLSLFFTALNLFPIGQLDGGHILYGLIGERGHRVVSPLIFIAFLFYAGLGWFRCQDFILADPMDFAIQSGYLLGYAGLLFWCLSRLDTSNWTIAAIALGIILVQLGLTWFFPEIDGYRGFLPFAVMLGRFLGIYHPPAEIDVPIGWKRKVLGWFSLLVFVLCFSPTPFVIY